MAIPTSLNANKIVLQVKVSGTFQPLCILESREFSRENSFESKMLGDCADDTVVPQRVVRVSGQQWSISGQGVVDPANTAYTTLETAFTDGTNVEVKIIVNTSGANSYTGYALPTKVTLGGGMAGFATLSLEMQGDGALTIATVT